MIDIGTGTLGRALRIAGYVAVGLALTLTFLLLDNGITHEEGWMAYLFKAMPSDISAGMRYPLLFKNVFHDDIYLIRVVWFVSNFAAAFVFALGMCSYLKVRLGKNDCLIWVLTVVLLGQLAVPDQPFLHYYSLNLIVTELSFGCMLAALSGHSKILFTLAGILTTLLLSVMVPNVSIILFEMAFIIVVEKGRPGRWSDVVFFLLGPVLSALGYLCLSGDPRIFVNDFCREVVATVRRGDETYGLLYMVRWTFTALLYLLKLFVAALLVRGFSVFAGRLPFVRPVTVTALAALIPVMLLVWKYVPPTVPGGIGGRIRDLYWVGLFYMLLSGNFSTGKRDCLSLLVLLAVTPLCLSLGSAVPFARRYACYLSFITPAIFLLPHLGRRELGYLLMFVIFFTFARKAPFGAKWEGSVWLDQNIPLKSAGIDQNIKVDRKTVDCLEFCREHIPEGSSVLVHPFFWHYVEYLGYRSLSSSFFLGGIESVSALVDSCDASGGVWLLLPLPSGSELMSSSADLLSELRNCYPGCEEYRSDTCRITLVHISSRRTP